MNDQYETLKSGLSRIIVGNQPFILQAWETTEADRLLAKELIEKYSKEKEMSEDTWSKQFYKALEAVGDLTEQERLKLGNMLIALSPVKNISVSRNKLPDRNAKPLPLRQLGNM